MMTTDTITDEYTMLRAVIAGWISYSANQYDSIDESYIRFLTNGCKCFVKHLSVCPIEKPPPGRFTINVIRQERRF